MRKIWNKIVHARCFPAAVIAAVVCVVLSVYTGVSGEGSIVTRAVGTALLPAQRAITHTAVHVADTYNKYFKYDELVAENESLKQQVAELTGQLALRSATPSSPMPQRRSSAARWTSGRACSPSMRAVRTDWRKMTAL